jgi:hypothetical protein
MSEVTAALLVDDDQPFGTRRPAAFAALKNITARSPVEY